MGKRNGDKHIQNVHKKGTNDKCENYRGNTNQIPHLFYVRLYDPNINTVYSVPSLSILPNNERH